MMHGAWRSWLSADGKQRVMGGHGKPELVKALEAEGVAGLAAGFHTSAILSGEGRVYMWGHLMCKVLPFALPSSHHQETCTNIHRHFI